MCTLKHGKKFGIYDTRKKKNVEYFGTIQNYDKFSRWKIEFDKIYTLWKIHIYSTMINTKQVI